MPSGRSRTWLHRSRHERNRRPADLAAGLPTLRERDGQETIPSAYLADPVTALSGQPVERHIEAEIVLLNQAGQTVPREYRLFEQQLGISRDVTAVGTFGQPFVQIDHDRQFLQLQRRANREKQSAHACFDASWPTGAAQHVRYMAGKAYAPCKLDPGTCRCGRD